MSWKSSGSFFLGMSIHILEHGGLQILKRLSAVIVQALAGRHGVSSTKTKVLLHLLQALTGNSPSDSPGFLRYFVGADSFHFRYVDAWTVMNDGLICRVTSSLLDVNVLSPYIYR